MNPIFASEYLILLAIAIVLMGAWMSWHAAARCRRPYRIAITVCRSVALTGLAIVALNPGTWRVEKEQGDEEWAILVDRSRSMAVEDVGKRSRWAAARDASRRIASTANDTATGGRTFLFAEVLTNEGITADRRYNRVRSNLHPTALKHFPQFVIAGNNIHKRVQPAFSGHLPLNNQSG